LFRSAVTVNVVCGSGLNCVNMAAQMIEAGDADIVVAGGTENMDMAPFAMMKGRYGYRMGYPMGKSELVDTMVNDALWDAFNNYHMGITAENVADQWGLTREDLDNFAYNSQLKASEDIKNGACKEEIVPVVIKNKKGDIVFYTDEGSRLSAPEVLAKLKPAFKRDGKVTAVNASAINDGAAALSYAVFCLKKKKYGFIMPQTIRYFDSKINTIITHTYTSINCRI